MTKPMANITFSLKKKKRKKIFQALLPAVLFYSKEALSPLSYESLEKKHNLFFFGLHGGRNKHKHNM